MCSSIWQLDQISKAVWNALSLWCYILKLVHFIGGHHNDNTSDEVIGDYIPDPCSQHVKVTFGIKDTKPQIAPNHIGVRIWVNIWMWQMLSKGVSRLEVLHVQKEVAGLQFWSKSGPEHIYIIIIKESHSTNNCFPWKCIICNEIEVAVPSVYIVHLPITVYCRLSHTPHWKWDRLFYNPADGPLLVWVEVTFKPVTVWWTSLSGSFCPVLTGLRVLLAKRL